MENEKNESRVEVYNPSDKEQDIIDKVWMKYSSARDVRNRPHRQFNDRGFHQYMQDNLDRYNGYIPPRTDPAKDWGAKVFNNVTRRKTIAIVSHVSSERIKGEYFAKSQDNPDHKAGARIAKSMNEHASYVNNDDELQFYTALEATVKGTSVGFETYLISRRKVKNVIEYDPETGKIEYKEEEVTDYDDVYSSLIPLAEIYPGNIYERSVQKQPYIVWRTIMLEDDFEEEFGGYPKSKFVQAFSAYIEEDNPYKLQISEDLEDGEIEVIRYFNRFEDEMFITANGVLLTETVSPFPWNHKKYPFWKTIFEPFDEEFWYGKSLPDKLKSDQDVLNDMWRMTLDQTFLSIHKPIITDNVEGLYDMQLYPGAQLQVDDVNQFKEFNISPPESNHFAMMQEIERSMEKLSVDDATQGVSGSNATAFEVSVASEAARKVLSLFLHSLEWGIGEKLNLRLKNQFQFYQLPKIEMISSKKDASIFSEIRSLQSNNETLADGTTGTQIINVVEDEEDLPSLLDVTMKEVEERRKGRNIAYSYVTVEFLQKIDAYVRIVPNSSLKMSEALQRALELDFQDKMAKLYPDIANREEGFRSLLESYNKDPEKFITPPQQPMGPEGGGGQQPSQAGPEFGPGQGEATVGGNEILNSGRGVIREGANNA